MQKKIRVLIVDDSGYVVAAISNKLRDNPDIEIIGSARNGFEAIEKVKSLKPDVVTLDIIMPKMDGLTALGRIMTECPTPVIMLSAVTSENAASTIQALELGAVDYFLKTSVIKPVGNETDTTLITKIRTAAAQKPARKSRIVSRELTNRVNTSDRHSGSFNKLVVIGSSTGGPRALMELIPALPRNIPAAILVVQHMPPMFTKSLAERLNQVAQMEVSEARNGSQVTRGQILLAPGDYHMVIDEAKKIKLNQDPPVLGVRPSVNITMKSAAGIYRARTVGVILTGMGSDGTEGAAYIKEAGGRILAQDEESSAVYGMPMSVAKAGYVDKILPLNEMAEEIARICEKDRASLSAT